MMGALHPFPVTPPMPAITRILARFERDQLAGFIAVAIDLLDTLDGDPDREMEDSAGETVPVIDDPDVPPDKDDGDPDLEETDCEDSFVLSHQALANSDGAGCRISDPGGDYSSEDDPTGFMQQQRERFGPGCPISDPGGVDEGF